MGKKKAKKVIRIEARELPFDNERSKWSGIQPGDETEIVLEDGEQLVGIVEGSSYPWMKEPWQGGSVVISRDLAGPLIALVASEVKPDPNDLTDEAFALFESNLYAHVNEWLKDDGHVRDFEALSLLDPLTLSLPEVELVRVAKKAFALGWEHSRHHAGSLPSKLSKYKRYWDLAYELHMSARSVQGIRKKMLDREQELKDTQKRLQETEAELETKAKPVKLEPPKKAEATA